MLPIPRETREEEKKGTPSRICPYCDDNPVVHTLTTKDIVWMNKHFDEGKEGIPILFGEGIQKRTKPYNYEKGMFCAKCNTVWLWENTTNGRGCWATYVGKDVPRIRKVIVIDGKAYLNFLPIKDHKTGEYMPLLHPFAPLVKKPSTHELSIGTKEYVPRVIHEV
ncbi:MAG TPA: hypothetical protein VK487_08165 [Candidatus Bathyarchaeia archaeon]|nr:hypothetical protein [Candidatus Bathyarchaeia archaeon]